MKKNSKLIILLILILILLLGAYLIFSSTNNTSNDTASDTNEEQEISLPEFSLGSSDEVFPLLYSELNKWASDAKITSVSALGSSIENNESRIFYGVENGKFMTFSMSVFSVSKKETSSIMWKSGEIIMGSGTPIDDFLVDSYKTMPSFTPGKSFISSVTAVNTAKANGLDDTTNTYALFLRVAGNNYVWEVNERSKTELDEYGSSLTLNKYSIDAVSGNFLAKE